MSGFLSEQDTRAVVHMLGEVAGMTEPPGERRRALMNKLTALIDADTWVWCHSRVGGTDVYPFCLLEHGWASEEQRIAWCVGVIDPEFNQYALNRFYEGFPLNGLLASVRESEQEDPPPVVKKTFMEIGLSQVLCYSYPLGDAVLSSIGIYRQKGKPAFAARDQCLAHLVLSEIDWLHRLGTDVSANGGDLLETPPRERQILLLLLSGDSRKQIAYKLGLSPHTVADYCKSLHRRFHVNSRGELLSRFVGAQNSGRAGKED